MDDLSLRQTESVARQVLANLNRALEQVTDRPYDVAEVGALLRTIVELIRPFALAVWDRKRDDTGISREGIRLALADHPQQLGHLIVALNLCETDAEIAATMQRLRRYFTILCVDIQGLLCSSNFVEGAAVMERVR